MVFLHYIYPELPARELFGGKLGAMKTRALRRSLERR